MFGDLWWLTSRLAGYTRALGEERLEPNGTLLDAASRDPGPELEEIELRELAYVSGGHLVRGFEVRPRISAGPLPVLLYARGGLGPHGALEGEDLEFLAALATGGPYRVLATEYRGNLGGDGDDRAGVAEARDLANLVPVAPSLGPTVPGRVHAVGFSRGGTMVLMAVRDGLRLASAATVGGVTDLAQAFHEGSRLLRGAIRVSTGGIPRRHPAEYGARSPRRWIEEVDLPLLLLHGEDDDVIRLSHTVRMSARLRALGRPPEVRYFAGGDHKLLTHARAREAAILDFFERHPGG